MTYRPVIGIETHIQLNTKTKLFCSCLNEFVPDSPNKNICPFCTGQPGALPALNKAAVIKAIQFGVAVQGKIPNKTRWDRKNYFYPDSPAGYQISQYDNPIVENGKVEFYIEDKQTGQYTPYTVNLTRAHLEGDAGKMLHVGNKSLVDFNRSGAPLIEVVSEPEMNNAAQAMGYVSELQLIVRKIGISDGDMDKGQIRFDCNISLQNEDEQANNRLPKYKVEVKNINSVRALGRAIEYEIIRQTKLLESGEMPAQETRGWRDEANKSDSQRSKEDAQDYRYFPEPDLRILEIDPKDIPNESDLPELPSRQRERYIAQGISLQISNTFVTQPEVGTYFDSLLSQDSSISSDASLVKTVANIISGNLIAISEKISKPVSQLISFANVIDLAKLFSERKINNQGLSKALEILVETSLDAKTVVEENGLLQLNDDTALEAFVDVVIANNPSQVEEYKSGKEQIIGFLIGQCMKESKGKGNPQRFQEILKKKLG